MQNKITFLTFSSELEFFLYKCLVKILYVKDKTYFIIRYKNISNRSR